MQIDTLPNRITVIRLALIPLIVFFLLLHRHSVFNWLAALTFLLAAFSDFLDGHIARKQQSVTEFGSLLDQLADKFLVVSSLVMLTGTGRLNVVIVVILVLREMYVTSLRLFAAQEGFSVPVDKLGKWKTATQMTAIPLLMAESFYLGHFGFLLILIATVLSLYSAVEYSGRFYTKFKEAVALKKKKQNA